MEIQDPQRQSRGDFASRLGADGYFVDISVLEQAKGATESDVETALGVLNQKGGKIGAVAIVLMAELLPSTPNAPGPEYRVRGTVQVITAALFNDGENGTRKPAEAIARRVRQLIHNYDGGWGTWTFAGMEPIAAADGQVSYGVTFTRIGRDANYRKTPTPIITPEEGRGPQSDVTIEAEVGTDTYYTTDGSYPTPTNGTLYEAPFDVAAGVMVRAVSYFPQRQPSNVAVAIYSDELLDFDQTEFSSEFA